MSTDGSQGALGIIRELDVPIPMRDGVCLRANIFRPAAPGPFPGLLSRTPYGKAAGGHEPHVRRGYVVVAMDSRGRYASDGDFTLFTESTRDAEDGYDSVEWLAAQPWCDGKVGTFGASYCAWMQWMLAREQPPHLRAMCAVSIPTELTDVDWPGALRAGRRLHWLMVTMAPDLRRRAGLPPPHTPDQARQLWDDVEHGRILGLLPISALTDYLPSPLAEQWASWLREPNRCAWHFAEAHQRIQVPNLDFTGWYDHCSSLSHLPGMQANAATEVARRQSRVVIGPWTHVTLGQRQVADFDFGPDAVVDQTDMMLRWFDYWLKDIDNGIAGEPAVRYFVIGSGEWRSATSWPPPSSPQTHYLGAGPQATDIASPGTLTAEPAPAASCSYLYDPRDPVPTLWCRRLFAGPGNRRRLDHRRDIVRYFSSPLTVPIEIAGQPEVVLYVATTAPDTDFFARLIDDCAEGEALEVAMGMVRLRHRRGLDCSDLVTPGEVIELHLMLSHVACRFAVGHCLRLEVTSSDFPSYDRNHNTGGNDLFETQLVKAEQTVLHGGEHASRLILPVV